MAKVCQTRTEAEIGKTLALVSGTAATSRAQLIRSPFRRSRTRLEGFSGKRLHRYTAGHQRHWTTTETPDIHRDTGYSQRHRRSPETAGRETGDFRPRRALTGRQLFANCLAE